MTSILRLHYAPDNASLCVRIALEELGVPFETALVDRRTKAQRSAAYLALNPNGLIPVLETPHGPMFETGAILTWLSDRHGGLLPVPDAAERAHAMQWMFWLANTLHPTLRTLFYPDTITNGDHADLKTKERLIAALTVLENAANAVWLDAGDATAMGCYLGPMLRWCTLYGDGPRWFDLAGWPRLHVFAQRAETRPAVIRAAKAEGLGPTPFSAPIHPNPPEGSAL